MSNRIRGFWQILVGGAVLIRGLVGFYFPVNSAHEAFLPLALGLTGCVACCGLA